MQGQGHDTHRDAWARLRYAVVSPLLAAPPSKGELSKELDLLAKKTWRHPATGGPVRFGRSTIERWYYAARGANDDPVSALRQQVRRDRGQRKSIGAGLASVIREQHRLAPQLSYILLYENIAAFLRKNAKDVGPLPSASTVRRWMKANGLFKRRRRGGKSTAGALRAEQRFEEREVRSFEHAHVHALWHLDFHDGSRRVLNVDGRFVEVHLLGILDDRSRLCCHAQWYLAETAEDLVHGLSQAILKRGLPRMLMTDNGSAMRAAETQAGLATLGIAWEPTIVYSPYQNGKQENFWGTVEGRLMAMLEGEKDLTLALLNEATQAWLERDYNRREHSEIGMTPLARALAGPSVARESPGAEELRHAFRRVVERRQRRSDGTVLVEGQRFEVPARLGHLERVFVRYARWDLSQVDLWDPVERTVLARVYPQDKEKNAEGKRRMRGFASTATAADLPSPRGMSPLLLEMLDDERASGLPPAYLPQPKPERDGGKEEQTS